ncbi:MAG: lipopolysaccharide biosynthesis protein, partial [Bacteroidota bacterium]
MVSIKTNSYLKNVFTLMAGTIIGQGLVFLAAPLVFRLFSPAEITAMEQFVMVTTVLSVIVSGKYEFAIMHPREGEDARHILVLTLLVSAVMSTVIGFLGYFFRFELATILGDTLISAMLWALGPVLFFIAVSNTFNYWFSRQKQYKIAATAKVL